MPSLARNTVFNAIGSVAMLGSGFLTTLIAARVLGPQAVGLVAFATMIVALSLAVLDLGLPGAMTRFLPELRAGATADNGAAIAAAILLPYALLALAASGAIFVAMKGIDFGPGVDGTRVRALIAAGILAQALATFHYGVLRGQQRFATFALLAGLAGVVQIAVAWIGARSHGVVGVLWAPVIAFTVPALAALSQVRHARGGHGLALLRRIFAYSGQTWLIYVFTTLSWSRLEVYFLREAWSDHAAGLFAAGMNLANLALQGPLFLTGALLPHLVTRNVEDPSTLAPAFRTSLFLFALIVVPLTLCIAALTPVLLPLLFGQSFSDGGTAAAVLVAGNAAMAVIAIVQQFAFATERTRALLVWSAITATLTIVSGFTLIAHYGVMGAALGRTAILLTSAAVMLALAVRWGWPVPTAALAKILAASLVAALIIAASARAYGGVGGFTAFAAIAFIASAIGMRALIPLARRRWARA